MFMFIFYFLLSMLFIKHLVLLAQLCLCRMQLLIYLIKKLFDLHYINNFDVQNNGTTPAITRYVHIFLPAKHAEQICMCVVRT